MSINYKTKYGKPETICQQQVDEPAETLVDDEILQQILWRNRLLLETTGEPMLVYRQKLFGKLCSCVDISRQQPFYGCRLCFGTRYIGGYDYLGKALFRLAPANVESRVASELGLRTQSTPIAWTMPEPVLRSRDILIAKLPMPDVQELLEHDEPVVRGNLFANEDSLRKINITNIQKISLTANSGASFIEGKDFILTGGEIKLDEARGFDSTTTARRFRIIGTSLKTQFRGVTGADPDSSIDPDTNLSTEAVDYRESTKVISDGIKEGNTLRIFSTDTNPTEFNSIVERGSGADADYLVVTIAGSQVGPSSLIPVNRFIATIQGDTIKWLLKGNRPGYGSVYYVTYSFTLAYTKRYQIQKVIPSTVRGVNLSQRMDIELLEPNHIAYTIGSPFDNGGGPKIDTASLELIKQIRIDAGIPLNQVNDNRFISEVS